MHDDDILHGLLYADDIVLLASTAEELHKMLAIADAFARKYRFKFNASAEKTDKSAIMLFNMTKQEQVLARLNTFTISGEIYW